MTNEDSIEHFRDASGALVAIIVSGQFHSPGVTFFTPPDLSQQLGYMAHPAGKQIPPHVHNQVHRDVNATREVLFIRQGRLRVDLFDGNQAYLASRELKTGDVILLVSGGHGFEILEDVQMFEVKQGPYHDADITRFSPAPRT